MKRYKKVSVTEKFSGFCKDYFPTYRDNLIQLFIKISFLLCVAGILSGSVYFTTYYYDLYTEAKQINANKLLFENNDFAVLKEQNSDYCAWIRINGTGLDYPIYKADNNSFYLSHNSLKEKSNYGSIFLDYRCDFSKKNAVIYGNNADNGLMFSTLNRFRELDFYKSNYVIDLTYDETEEKYLIYAVFLLNSSKEQDNGTIYSIYQNDFGNAATFNLWVDEAKKRSVINTEIDVKPDDDILTLVTDCNDFENARLVVMARKARYREYIFNENKYATVNSKPRYPKKWYDERNIKYPF